jgi:integrase
VWYRGAWWIRTHHKGRKRDKKVGPAATDKRQAQEIARKVNASIELGTYTRAPETKALPCDADLRRWHTTYSATFKQSHEVNTLSVIENHLAPHFGAKDLGDITESDLLDYVRVKLHAGQAPATILNALSILRRVLNLAHRDGHIARNPALRLGELMRRVDRRTAQEVKTVESWTRDEASTLLDVARLHETRFHPVLLFLLSTGCRRGEALGLRWLDVDFEHARIHIRRARVRCQETTPKSGRGRFVAMPAATCRRPPRSAGTAPSGGPTPRLAGGPALGVLLGGRHTPGGAQRRTVLVSGPQARPEAGSSALPAPCSAPHLRQPGPRLGEKPALGG